MLPGIPHAALIFDELTLDQAWRAGSPFMLIWACGIGADLRAALVSLRWKSTFEYPRQNC